MEILLKAKQAGNPQFDFLSHDSSLHSYYRHILMAIKTGRLNCQPPPQKPTGKHLNTYTNIITINLQILNACLNAIWTPTKTVFCLNLKYLIRKNLPGLGNLAFGYLPISGTKCSLFSIFEFSGCL